MTLEQIHSAWADAKSRGAFDGIKVFARAIESATNAKWEEATKQLQSERDALAAELERVKRQEPVAQLEFFVDENGPALTFTPLWYGHLTNGVYKLYTTPPAQPAQGPATFQDRVNPWMQACFGDAISKDLIERNHRFLEESLELVQSTGCTSSEAHQLVDYVFGRDVGDPHQEVGGVMVTLAALCLAAKMDMHQCGETELSRIWTKVDVIRAKQAAKPKHSPLPIAQPAPTENKHIANSNGKYSPLLTHMMNKRMENKP
jgi:hypothetical protein